MIFVLVYLMIFISLFNVNVNSKINTYTGYKRIDCLIIYQTILSYDISYISRYTIECGGLKQYHNF